MKNQTKIQQDIVIEGNSKMKAPRDNCKINSISQKKDATTQLEMIKTPAKEVVKIESLGGLKTERHLKTQSMPLLNINSER